MKRIARLAPLAAAALASTAGTGCVLAALGAVGALAVASGGSHTESIEISHPAHVGYLEQNVIRHDYGGTEVEYGLPAGALADEASMVSLTPVEACFDVRVRNRDEHAARYVDLSRWRMLMETSEDVEMGPTAFVPKMVESAGFNGRRPRQVLNGYTTECVQTDPNTSACRRWEERPNYTTVYDPAVVTVVTGGAQLCFAHGGRITPQTEWIELHLLSPDEHELGFEWEFRDPPMQAMIQNDG